MDFKEMRVVWLGLLGGLGAYAMVVYALLAIGDAGIEAIPARFMPYATAGGIALMLTGLGVRRRLLGAIPRGVAEAKRLQQYFVATLVGLAMIEGGGVLIITLSLVADTPTWALVGGGAGLWMMMMARPERDALPPGGAERR